MKILFVFDAKVQLLFDICKYFAKKNHFLCVFFHFFQKMGIFEHTVLQKTNKFSLCANNFTLECRGSCGKNFDIDKLSDVSSFAREDNRLVL